jgi:hypothetical protein
MHKSSVHRMLETLRRAKLVQLRHPHAGSRYAAWIVTTRGRLENLSSVEPNREHDSPTKIAFSEIKSNI